MHYVIRLISTVNPGKKLYISNEAFSTEDLKKARRFSTKKACYDRLLQSNEDWQEKAKIIPLRMRSDKHVPIERPKPAQMAYSGFGKILV